MGKKKETRVEIAKHKKKKKKVEKVSNVSNGVFPFFFYLNKTTTKMMRKIPCNLRLNERQNNKRENLISIFLCYLYLSITIWCTLYIYLQYAVIFLHLLAYLSIFTQFPILLFIFYPAIYLNKLQKFEPQRNRLFFW